MPEQARHDLSDPAPLRPVPVDWSLDGRDITEPRQSPSGADVAVVVRWQGAAAVVLVAVTGGPERILTTSPPPSPGRGMGGGCFDWLPDGSGIVYSAADGELWLQPLDAAARRLTRFERVCRAPAVSPDGRFVVFVVDEAEVWLTELGDAVGEPSHGGASHRLDDGVDAFCFDPHVGPDSATVVWSAWSPPAMPWDAAHVVRVDIAAAGSFTAPERWRPEGAAVQQPRLLADGSLGSVHDASGWLNLYLDDDVVMSEAAEHGDPPWGMGQRSFAPSPDGRRMAYACNVAGFGSLRVVERTSGRCTEVATAVHGQLQWHGGHLTALRSGPQQPTSVVAYDTDTWEATELVVGPLEGWRHVSLPEPEPVVVDCPGSAANGVDTITLHARRYPAGRGHMLCWVHGGPTDQWRADFRARVVHWWSRGWDVLVVDPRGTTGHGRAYRTALEGAWGRTDVDDTAALVRHAHDQGWATPATTVMMGGSSGGLTVLGMLADHPELVAGGVTSYPVSDLADLATTTHRFEAHYTDTLVGPADDPETNDRLIELSPLHRAHLIRGPLLLFHGSDDPVVPVAQSEVLVERIRDAGGAVDVVVFDGEGHGFRDRDHQLEEYARTERFLDDLVSSDAEPNLSG
jgi:dipeptidyl aminopeptidase/acylaminoacyl peptidase